MGRRIFALSAFVAVAMLFAHATRAHAQGDQTETEKIAECLQTAWDHYEACIDDSPWWMTWPCGWKLEADAVLCLPKAIIKM